MGEMVNVVNANHNKTRSHVQCYELNGKSNSEDEFFSVSPLSNQAPIQENKPSPLERSFESSTQKIEELGHLYTEVKGNLALVNSEEHLAKITLKTQAVNADVSEFMATAESAIDDLPEEKQDSVRQKIAAEAKESANDMNNGVKMYHSIADVAMNKNVSMYELIVNTINAISRGNMDLTSKVASKYNKYNTAVSNFIVNMHKLTESKGSDVVMNRAKVEQELRQLIKDYSSDQEAGILYSIEHDNAEQSEENKKIAIKKAEDLSLDPANVVKQKGNKWLVTLDTSPLDKMLESLPEYKNQADKDKAEKLIGILSSNDYKESIRIAVQEGVWDKSYNDSNFLEKMDPDPQMKFALLLRKNHASNIEDVITQEQVDRLEALIKAGDAFVREVKSKSPLSGFEKVDPDIFNVPYSFLASYKHGDWKKWMPEHHRVWVEGGEKQKEDNPNLVIEWGHVKHYLRETKKEFLRQTIEELTGKGVDIEATKAEFFKDFISEKVEKKLPKVSMNASQYNIFSKAFTMLETQIETAASAVTRKAAGVLTNIETLIQKLMQNLKSIYETFNSAIASIRG